MANIKPGRGDILIQVSNRSGIKRLGEKVAKKLEKASYAVPVVEEGSDDSWDNSIIYHTRKKADQADEISSIIASPNVITPARYKLKGVGVLLVLGKDMAGWRP